MDQDYAPRWNSEQPDDAPGDALRRTQFQQELINLFRPSQEQATDPEDEDDDDESTAESSKRKRRSPRGWRQMFRRFVRRDSSEVETSRKQVGVEVSQPVLPFMGSGEHPQQRNVESGSADSEATTLAEPTVETVRQQSSERRTEQPEAVDTLNRHEAADEVAEAPPVVPPPLFEHTIFARRETEADAGDELGSESAEDILIVSHDEERLAQSLDSGQVERSDVVRPSAGADGEHVSLETTASAANTFGDTYKSKRRYRKVKRALSGLKSDAKRTKKERDAQQHVAESFAVAQTAKNARLSEQLHEIEVKAERQFDQVSQRVAAAEQRNAGVPEVSKPQNIEKRQPEGVERSAVRLAESTPNSRHEKLVQPIEEKQKAVGEADSETQQEASTQERTIERQKIEKKEQKELPVAARFEADLKKELEKKPERVFDQRHEILDRPRTEMGVTMPVVQSSRASGRTENTHSKSRQFTAGTQTHARSDRTIVQKATQSLDQPLYRRSVQYGVGSALVIVVLGLIAYVVR